MITTDNRQLPHWIHFSSYQYDVGFVSGSFLYRYTST